jgi:hypothetical protein
MKQVFSSQTSRRSVKIGNVRYKVIGTREGRLVIQIAGKLVTL